MSNTELRRLCDDIAQLDSGVHQDILQHVPPALLTRNGNGVFFDLTDVSPANTSKIKDIVEYAKSTKIRQAEHDRNLFESSQHLVAGPIETVQDDAHGAKPVAHGAAAANGGAVVDGEEGFKTAMESGCVSKPAKGVLVKK